MADDKQQAVEQLRRQVVAAKRVRAIQLAKDNMLSFARLMMPDPEAIEDTDKSLYAVKEHHKLLCAALEEVAAGKNLRLIISMPPQHGKSQLTSRFFPAWFMGRMPFRNLMQGTYNQSFAEEFGDDVRTIINSPEFAQVFPQCKLRQGSKAKDHMVTERNGKMSFLGRGGSGTGRPADLFIIDDPLKDAKEAESLTIRNDVWEWFTKVAYTRCHALTAIVIIATRWHEDDLIGRITDPTNPYYDSEEAKKWTYINVPAIVDEPRIAEALGLNVGDALWAERFSLAHLESARRLNPLGFSALYMGRPTPPEGAFFKLEHLKTYEERDLPKNGRHYLSGDLALTPESDRDHSVVGMWRLAEDGCLYLLPDLYWEQKGPDYSVEKIIGMIRDHKPLLGWWEKGQIARAVGPFLEKRMYETGHYVKLEQLPTAGSKGGRATSIRGLMMQGRVKFPRFAPWWTRAKDEMLKFTGSGEDKSDDFCDMCALIGAGLNMQMTPRFHVPEVENVIPIGTMRWVKEEHNREMKHRKAIAARKNF